MQHNWGLRLCHWFPYDLVRLLKQYQPAWLPHLEECGDATGIIPRARISWPVMNPAGHPQGMAKVLLRGSYFHCHSSV
jgi:hypothetical protein